MSTPRAGIIRNVASNYGMMLLSVASGLLFTPYLLHRLGADAYGLWGVISAILGYATLADLGLSGAVVKYTAQYRAAAAPESIHRLVSTALACYLGLGAACGLLVLGLAPLLGQVIKIPGGTAEVATAVFLLWGLNTALSFPLSVVSNYVLGLQRYDVRNGASLLTTLLNIGLSILLLEAGLGLLGVALASVATSLALFAILGGFVFRRTGAAPVLAARYVDRAMARQLFAYGASATVINITGMISWNTDNIVVGTMVGVSAVTPYVLGGKVREMFARLIWAFLSVLIPAFSAVRSLTSPAQVATMYLRALRVVVFLSFPVGLVLIMRRDLVLQTWVGLHDPAAATVLALLVFAVVMHLPSDVALVALLGAGTHRVLTLLSIADAALNLGLSVLLVALVGPPGAALGTAVTVVLTGGIGIPVLGCRHLGIPAGAHFAAIGRGLLALLPVAVILATVPDDLARQPLPALGLAAGAAAVYLPEAAFLLLTPAERRAAGQQIGARLAAIRRKPVAPEREL